MSLMRNSRWQDVKTTVEDALSYMYKHTIFDDVSIQTISDEGSSMCFSAHKLVLATRSPVFADMFYSRTRNSNIVSLNISRRALDILLWYIYCDCIDVDDIEELVQPFDAAVYYEICGFSERCVEKLLHLSSSLSESNLYSVIKIASYAKSDELLRKCIEFIEKEPENSLLSEEFQSISEETLSKILKELKSNIFQKTLLKAIIKWLIGNNLSDKKFISIIDFSLLNADDFLNIVEEFPDFFSVEEIHAILPNFLLPESSEPPPWCKFSKTKDRCIKIPPPSQYEVMEIVKENAMKLQTECSQKFHKISFFSLRGFQQDLLLKICVQSRLIHLVMLELAFGSDYVPEGKLRVKLRSNIGSGRKMQAVKHYLLSSRAHYYVLLCNNTRPEIGDNFKLLLSVEARGLLEYGPGGQVSNQRYRPALVSDCDSIDLSTHCSIDMAPTISLKPFSEFLVLVDPEYGEKKFVISAFYFDTLKNIRKYEKVWKSDLIM